MHRVWGLRVSLSAYDATDVAPAEALGATLLRWDDKLARVHEHAATIALVRIDS
jgi:predicted nucleic acid-binding protein